MKKLFLVASLFISTLLLSGCGGAKGADATAVLTSGTWQLQSIEGTMLSETGYSRGLPHITFTTDNKVNGNSGCNGFGGSYNLNDEGGINISQVIATKMYCEGVKENEFFKALEEAETAVIKEDKLVLMKGIDEVLVFVPKE